MEYWVYILFSPSLCRYYTGSTTDVMARLRQHNDAHYPDAYTRKGIPWSLFLSILGASSAEAYKLEKFIKAMKSTAFIQRLKEDPAFLASVLAKN